MQGLVLEGGGVRGAYHVGALKALFENGYIFDGVVGTSIGAINGAMVAQGEFDNLYKEWTEMSYAKILDVDEVKFARFLNKHINIKVFKYITSKVTETLKNGGFDTKKMRDLFSNYIDEEKLRKSNVEFGLVTYNMTDFKKVELFLPQIPEGMLIDFLLASSRLPIFKAEVLKDKKYIDGGIYNNCPINMFDKKEYKKIIVIRTCSENRIKLREKMKNKDIEFLVIRPYEELPSIMHFDNKVILDLIKLGYYDGIKAIEELDGHKSYVYKEKEEFFFKLLTNIDKKKIHEISDILFGEKKYEKYKSKKLLLEKILPYIEVKLKQRDSPSYKSLVYSMLEYVMSEEDIEYFKIYKFDELLETVKSKIRLKDKKGLKLAIYKLIKEL